MEILLKLIDKNKIIKIWRMETCYGTKNRKIKRNY